MRSTLSTGRSGGLRLLGGLVLLAWAAGGLWAQKDSCRNCHRELEGELGAPVTGFEKDVHRRYGLGCSDCHGGNPNQEDIELAKDKTFKGAPSRSEIPQFCGGCHADEGFIRKFNPNLRIDQLSLYRTSRHGMLLARGDAKVAVCTDCHGVHGILPGNIPTSSTFPWNIPRTCGRCHSNADLMGGYGIPSDQVERYKGSVHAQALFEKKDLGAAVCNSCHGNHGALPPSVSSIAFVCRQCHPGTAELFDRSPHRPAFDELGLAECDACHGHHDIARPSDALVGTGSEALCIRCHDAGSQPYRMAGRVSALIEGYVGKMRLATGLLDEARGRGVEVGPAALKIQQVQTSLVELRNLTHGLSWPDLSGKAAEGQAVLDQLLVEARRAVREGTTRREWLALVVFFLCLTVAALLLKVRSLRPPHGGG
jgi:predicted CXXCH cytochrome family protein